MSPRLAVRTCPVKHCGKVHPAHLVTDTGCIACSLGMQQAAAYAEHRCLILASPQYAEQAARRERAYYHPAEPADAPAFRPTGG